MKKFFLALLAFVCFACLGIAAAACGNAKYYTLYFNAAEGANVVCEIPSGYEVKEGYRVVFQVELDGDAHGTPSVAVNGDTIEADANGFYSFKMKKDTTVTVTGVYATGRHAVIFDKGDKDKNEYRVTYKAEYVDENGKLVEIDTDEKEGTPLKEGTEVAFTVGVSVYYGENPKFDVLENTQIITPEADGKYHVTISKRVTVSIQGLELDDSFVGRKNGNTTYVDGNGTRENPYKIRKPIDLYVMASLVNSEFFYSQTGTAYYSLENDIDLKGEELFIIGASNEFYFGGDFNGNGHTISNYYISANAVDQDSYEKGFMPNIGLFGVAAGAKIYDLNLADFSYDIDAAPWEEGFFAGGIVAYGVGVEITNCSVNCVMRLTADTNRFGYAGGIIGYMMSAYDQPSNTRLYATVRSCSTNVNIVGRAGYIYGAGGIAGNIGSSDESTTAMIINCYATGNVSGAMRTGGIVGAVSSYGSVINCYATGYVDAYNRLGNDPEYEGFRYAYSGGIAGELECDAIIANCFFTGETLAIASAGQNYAKAGDIAGSVAPGGMEGGVYVHAERGIIYNCAPDEDGSVSVDDIDNNYIKTVLKWSDGDWAFNDSGYPAVNAEDGSNLFKITVNLKNGTVGGKTAVEQNVSDAYIPMSYWYVYAGSNLEEYLTDDNDLRSFGYYFDENLTLKVPNSYVPVHEITLWAAFADYSEVSGKYYLQWTQNGSGKYLELKDDGTLIYRDGALTSESYYYYDGEYVTLRNTYIALIDGLSEGAYTSFKATVENGVMTIWDNQYYPSDNSVKAIKEETNFGYGKYYGAGVEYIFNTDGTGVYTVGENRHPFTFTVNGGSVKIELDGATINETLTGGKLTEVNGVALTHCDWFAGVWEKSAGSHKEYTFDGKGGWSYVYYGYDNNGNVVAVGSPVTGTYTVSGNEIDLHNGTKFTVKDGVLSQGNEVYYYKQYSYAGSWSNMARQFAIEIALDGITTEGYGKATINYGSIYGSYELTYGVKISDLTLKTGVDANGDDVYTTFYENVPVISMYNGDVLIASLTYIAGSRTLWGGVYSLTSSDMEITTFYLYDDFRGDWISAGMDVTFNGLGNYDVAGAAGILPVKGEVKVNGVSAGAYTLVNNTLTGSFEYNGGTYNISYDEASGKINVTGAGSFNLERRDEWYGVKLIDGSGNVYSFDGRGNLSGGGIMTVTAPNGTVTTNSYNGSTINVSGNVYKYGATSLYLYNQFTGTWYVSGTYGQTLVIGNFGADNTAAGSYLGQSYTFVYHRDGNYVTLADPAHPELLPLYINVLDGGDVVELAVAYANNTQDLESVCVKTNSDGHEGDYAYNGGTLTLDGLGKCAFTDGSAKYVKGETVERYTYVVDEFNQVLLLSLTDGKYYIFGETDETEGVYEKDGKHYAKVLPDNLYTLKANLTVGEESVLVSFYGNGKAVASDGSVYAYEIKDQNTTLMEYFLTMTIGGETKDYVLDYNSDYDEAEEIYYVMTVVDELYRIQATLGDNVITFLGNGAAESSDGSPYTYVIISYDAELKVYRLSLINFAGKGADYALDCSKDYDPDNEEYYTLTKL